ncbi:hypothetical protein FF011L_15760 [Roseimaritima multifibrata]|uniref:Uncharacterized protein n=1 Tax=Roseimaritima multifibrata TaxID=1930274 RepID=A0A517MDG7_9BACT|nr:hypothetical protein [Roseimaritima multifibrata]QDS92827.1 hypothetical protein FF011L_15760 [Roseimaritima multifibrata]
MVSAHEVRGTVYVEKLARYEQRLEIPVVPGELIDWLDAVSRVATDVAVDFRQRLRKAHAELFAVILERDLALAARVEEMKHEGVRLAQQARRIANAFERLAKDCRAEEPDEANLLEEVQRYSAEALSMIIGVRKLDSAVTTWYMEAFDRDRGIVD